jgi:hypothetical protein
MKVLAIFNIILLYSACISARPLESEEESFEEDESTVQSVRRKEGSFQGDLMLSNEQKRMFEASGDVAHTGVRGSHYRWHKDLKTGKVMVPYTFDSASRYSE